jgi:ribonuclease HI
MTSSLLFTDGACSGNPGPGGFGTIAVDQKKSFVKELGGFSPKTTNNQMELLAVIMGLEWLERQGVSRVDIWTDSTYVIQGITGWVYGWRRRNWVTASGSPVLNQELWQRLLLITEKFPAKNSLSWNYVRGHQGVPGNERCDLIAVQFSKGSEPSLFEGPLSEYSVPLTLPEGGGALPQRSSSSGESGASKKAQSYLSLIGGIVTRHKDWASCERRVKGKPGAKFKKSTASLSEEEVLKSWGLNPQTVQIKED